MAQLAGPMLTRTEIATTLLTGNKGAPRHAPNMSYELGPVIAALENRRYLDRRAIHDLHDAENLLQPRLQALNAAFSERDFAIIKQKLW